MKPTICIDSKIPFIRGRIEHCANAIYLDADALTGAKAADADALIIRTRTRCDSHTLEALRRLRCIATATIGTDHIDLDFCRKAGISVSNAAGCNAPGVAQYVWSALLRLGFDPQSHLLGIIGCGNVGSIVAQWGSLTGTRMIICDPFKESELRRKGFHTAPLHSLLKQCDAVSLHVPLTGSGAHPTRHLIDASAISLLKPGAILINASRGEVAATDALIQGAGNKNLRLVVDTWEGEPRISRRLLEKAAIATPHIAGYSLQGKQRATRMALAAVARELGISPDLSGLEPDYIPSPGITAASITGSYDPFADDKALRSRPQDFETLRSEYSFRNEPS